MLWMVGWCLKPLDLIMLIIFFPSNRAGSLFFRISSFLLYCALNLGCALEVWPPMLVNFSKVLLQPGNLHFNSLGCYCSSWDWGMTMFMVMFETTVWGVDGHVIGRSSSSSATGCFSRISFVSFWGVSFDSQA